MRLKNYFWASAALISLSLMTISCTEETVGDSDTDKDNNSGVEDSTDLGDFTNNDVVEWEAGKVVELKDHFTVPEGKTLIIKEGVQVIATGKVGMNELPIEFTVKGNLYCQGTEEKPILFSIPENERTETNIFEGKWGGIVATETCKEMLIDHTIIEYVGGEVLEGAPAAAAGIYEAGDDAYPQITTTNVSGNYVITNSILRYGVSDAIYMMGGNAIITNNIFCANGETGEEAVNVKSGCVVDVAGNLMYAPNTNGLKLSSKSQSEKRGQAKIQAYNNTIVNAGWRRDSDKGGSIYVEENACVHVFNNLIVNSKFKATTPLWEHPGLDGGYDVTNSVIDYNYYASGSQKVDESCIYEENISYSYEGYNHKYETTEEFGDDEVTTSWYNSSKVDVNSIVASMNEDKTLLDGKNPDFVDFDINNVPLNDYKLFNADGTQKYDFHLQAGSKALAGESELKPYSGTDAAMQPAFLSTGLTVNGKTYNSPAPAARYGAYGQK